MVLVLIGMICLFLKIDFTLRDTSLFYLLTNLIGFLLLKWGLDDNESVNGQKLTDQLWFYGVMNVLLLACHFFDVEVYGIGLDYFESYILAFTILFAHFYVFFYPLYVFSSLLKFDTHVLQRPFSYSVNYVVPICVSLALISFSAYTSGSVRSLLWVSIIILELHASFRLLMINYTRVKLDTRLGEKLLHLFRKSI